MFLFQEMGNDLDEEEVQIINMVMNYKISRVCIWREHKLPPSVLRRQKSIRHVVIIGPLNGLLVYYVFGVAEMEW